MNQGINLFSVNRNWRKEEVSVLIALYQSEACLYDQHHPKYHNSEEKDKAYERIQNVLTSIRSHYSIPEIKTKIQSLYSKYVLEKLHKDQGILNGQFTEHSYKPIMWCFGLLEFLDKHIEKNKSTEEKSNRIEAAQSDNSLPISFNYISQNIKKEIDSDIESDVTLPDSNSAGSGSQYQNRSMPSSEIKTEILDTDFEEAFGNYMANCTKENQLFGPMSKKMKNTQEQPSSESSEREDVFGEYVASEMKTLKANISLYLQTKQAIVDVLTSASFEYLNSERN